MSIAKLNKATEQALEVFCEKIERAYAERIRDLFDGELKYGSPLMYIAPTDAGELKLAILDIDGDLLPGDILLPEPELTLPLSLLPLELAERLKACSGDGSTHDDYVALISRMRAVCDEMEAMLAKAGTS